MTSICENYGHEEDFVDAPPDYLKCVICHLVLRNPVQLMQCGHRYCHLCFENIKGYSEQFNSDLSCPIDRQLIDLTKVFKDTGITRLIDDLDVKCEFQNMGCEWVGELRNAERHRGHCSHKVKKNLKENVEPSSIERNSTMSLLKGMCERLNKCEQGLLDKEKDLAYAKLHLHETEEKVTKREDEIGVLKLKNIHIENKLNFTKESNRKFQGHVEMVLKCESQNAASKNREEVNRLQMEREITKEALHFRDTEIHNLRVEINELSRELFERKTQKSQLCTSCKSLTKIEEDLKNVEEQQNPSDDYVKISPISPTCMSLDKVNSRKKALVTKGNNNHEIHHEILNKVDELRSSVTNAHGVLSDNKNVSLGDTVFEWKIHNLKDHFIAGKPIESPTFYSRPNGHLCRLYAEFEDDEFMGINLKVTSEENSVDIESFSMDVLFEILKHNGKKIGYPSSNNIILEDYSLFFGDGIIQKREVDDYIINNTCTVICTLSSNT